MPVVVLPVSAECGGHAADVPSSMVMYCITSLKTVFAAAANE